MAALLAIATAAAAVYFWPTGAVGPPNDALSGDQVVERQRAFDATGRIALRLVGGDERERALDSMGLDDGSRSKLLVHLTQAAAATNAVSPASALPDARAASSPSLPSMLAWVTLWDTDAVDGDVVRIVSEGYSRDVSISRRPATFAIPVPRAGVVNLVGVRDGGGGITVGMLSGGARVALPLMSEGQSLGVPVVAR